MEKRIKGLLGTTQGYPDTTPPPTPIPTPPLPSQGPNKYTYFTIFFPTHSLTHLSKFSSSISNHHQSSLSSTLLSQSQTPKLTRKPYTHSSFSYSRFLRPPISFLKWLQPPPGLHRRRRILTLPRNGSYRRKTARPPEATAQPPPPPLPSPSRPRLTDGVLSPENAPPSLKNNGPGSTSCGGASPCLSAGVNTVILRVNQKKKKKKIFFFLLFFHSPSKRSSIGDSRTPASEKEEKPSPWACI